MKMVKRGFISAKSNMRLVSRLEALLNAFAHRKVFLFNCFQQQSKILGPMCFCRFRRRRLRYQQGNPELDRVNATGKRVPKFNVLTLPHKDSGRKQYIDAGEMLRQVPFSFRLVLQHSDAAPGKQQAQVFAKGVKRADIAMQNWVDRLFV